MRSNSSGINYRQVLTVLVIGWVVRCLFVWFLPPAARSADSFSWETVADLLGYGLNPYHETTMLNWPPFWMQCIYLVSKLALALNVSFILILRIFLAGVESLVVVALFGLIPKLAPHARVFPLLLWGIALNPVAIFLTCQHCNFDVLVGLWALLFVERLVQYHRSGNVMAWLTACFFLGLAILTKTVPLVLCPMLAGGLHRVPWKAKWIGVALVFGPVTLGMSVIYVLTPADVSAKVLGYRSATGWFGISGLLQMAHAEDWIGVGTGLFYAWLAAAGILVAFAFWRREQVKAQDIVLCAALFLVGIPALGPGFSPQYLYWSVPLLLASYFLYDGWWPRWLVVLGIVAALTYILEYAIVASHGMYFLFLAKRAHYDMTLDWAWRLYWLESPAGQTMMRLPLFAVLVALLITGSRTLWQNFRAKPQLVEVHGPN